MFRIFKEVKRMRLIKKITLLRKELYKSHIAGEISLFLWIIQDNRLEAKLIALNK